MAAAGAARRPRVLVAGGGISGLSLAWFVRRLVPSARVTIAEASNRAGGWVHSRRHAGGDVEELGPRSALPRSERLLRLIYDIGLHKSILYPELAAKRRYVWRDGELYKTPSSIMQVLRDRVVRRALWRDTVTQPRAVDVHDESVHDFFARRFGEEAAALLGSALVAGVYAGSARQLSARSAFPELWDGERKYGSVVRWMARSAAAADAESRKLRLEAARESARRGESEITTHPRNEDEAFRVFAAETRQQSSYSFAGGMQSLTDRLAEALRAEGDAVDLRLNTRVSNLRLRSEEGEDVAAWAELGGRGEQFDHVFLALAARDAAAALSAEPAAAELRAALEAVPYASVQVVTLRYGRDQQVSLPAGFGMLVPESASLELLGVSFDSQIFPQLSAPDTAARVSLMLGGARHPHLVDLGQEQLLSLALAHMRTCFGVTATPRDAAVSLARNCIPQFPLGFHISRDAMRNQVAALFPRLTLLGPFINGVSLNSCVDGAWSSAESFARSFGGKGEAAGPAAAP